MVTVGAALCGVFERDCKGRKDFFDETQRAPEVWGLTWQPSCQTKQDSGISSPNVSV